MRPPVPFAPFDQFLTSVHKPKTTYFHIGVQTLLNDRFRHGITYFRLADIDPVQVAARPGKIEMRIGAQPELRPVFIVTVLAKPAGRAIPCENGACVKRYPVLLSVPSLLPR